MAGYIPYVHWASFTEVDWERKDVAIGSNPTTLRKSQKELGLIIYHLFFLALQQSTFSHLPINIFKKTFLNAFVYDRWKRPLCQEVKGQLCGASFLLPCFRGFWSANEGHQTCTVSSFTRDALLAPQTHFPWQKGCALFGIIFSLCLKQIG